MSDQEQAEPDSPSGALWRHWFTRLGALATVLVINATSELVIGGCEIARADLVNENQRGAAPIEVEAHSDVQPLPHPRDQAIQIVKVWRATDQTDGLLRWYIQQAIQDNNATRASVSAPVADTGEFYIEGDMLWCGDHGIARFVNSQTKANRKLLCSMLNSVSALTAERDSLRAVVVELAAAAKVLDGRCEEEDGYDMCLPWPERIALRAALTKLGEITNVK